MSTLFKLLLTLVLLSPLFVFAQVPAAPSNGLWGIIASQYQVGYCSGNNPSKNNITKYDPYKICWGSIPSVLR